MEEKKVKKHCQCDSLVEKVETLQNKMDDHVLTMGYNRADIIAQKREFELINLLFDEHSTSIKQLQLDLLAQKQFINGIMQLNEEIIQLKDISNNDLMKQVINRLNELTDEHFYLRSKVNSANTFIRNDNHNDPFNPRG